MSCCFKLGSRVTQSRSHKDHNSNILSKRISWVPKSFINKTKGNEPVFEELCRSIWIMFGESTVGKSFGSARKYLLGGIRFSHKEVIVTSLKKHTQRAHLRESRFVIVAIYWNLFRVWITPTITETLACNPIRQGSRTIRSTYALTFITTRWFNFRITNHLVVFESSMTNTKDPWLQFLPLARIFALGLGLG